MDANRYAEASTDGLCIKLYLGMGLKKYFVFKKLGFRQ